MGAIPRSGLAGHQRLHERATTALDLCQESEGVDFKESASWDTLKWRITHSALGMGNLRDGGIIVIGVAERHGNWVLSGIDPSHLASFDPDVVAAQVNTYISPYADFDMVLVSHRASDYLVIQIREFRDTPLVCKKNGPNGAPIVEGRVYVRLPSPARTTVVTNAQQMHDLLELAAEKRARGLLEGARRVGLIPGPQDTSKYDLELNGL